MEVLVLLSRKMFIWALSKFAFIPAMKINVRAFVTITTLLSYPAQRNQFAIPYQIPPSVEDCARARKAVKRLSRSIIFSPSERKSAPDMLIEAK